MEFSSIEMLSGIYSHEKMVYCNQRADVGIRPKGCWTKYCPQCNTKLDYADYNEYTYYACPKCDYKYISNDYASS